MRFSTNSSIFQAAIVHRLVLLVILVRRQTFRLLRPVWQLGRAGSTAAIPSSLDPIDLLPGEQTTGVPGVFEAECFVFPSFLCIFSRFLLFPYRFFCVLFLDLEYFSSFSPLFSLSSSTTPKSFIFFCISIALIFVFFYLFFSSYARSSPTLSL